MGDFVHFFLTLFLTRIMGMDESTTGMFVMAVSLSRIAGAVIAGKIGDRRGRKMIMLFFLLMFAVTLIFSGLFVYSMATPVLLIIAGLFNGAERPLNNTIVADITTREERKQAFSLLYLGINIGVAVGPMLAGLLFNNYIRWIFFGDALTSLIAIVLIFKFVPESKPDEETLKTSMETAEHDERAEVGSTFKVFLKRPVLAASTLFMVLCNLVYAQHAFSLPIQLDNLFSEDSARLYGYIMSFNAGIVLLATSILLHITKRSLPLRNISYANLLYALGFGMIAYIQPFPMFLVSAFFWTIGEILVVTNYNVFIANHTPISHRGRFNGLLQVILGMGFAISPFLSGIFVDTVGLSTLWKGIGILSISLAIGMFLLSEWDKRRNKSI
jgi:MFS family permease